MTEVDDIVAAWQRERPELDVSALHVLSRVDRLAARLAGQRREIFARHRLALDEFDVLAALRRAGEPYQLTAGQLAASTYVTTGTMTNRLTKLAARRLVRRHSDASDGRVALVWLTGAGRSRVDAALADLLVAENAMLAGLGRTGRRQLAESLQRVLDASESAAHGVAARA
jgi:DNA-binding MarR family transcriptional regulator